MVAATFAGAAVTKATASEVVMCSITIFSFGNFSTSGCKKGWQTEDNVGYGMSHPQQQNSLHSSYRLFRVYFECIIYGSGHRTPMSTS